MAYRTVVYSAALWSTLSLSLRASLPLSLLCFSVPVSQLVSQVLFQSLFISILFSENSMKKREFTLARLILSRGFAHCFILALLLAAIAFSAFFPTNLTRDSDSF